jgi:hypothetical protein
MTSDHKPTKHGFIVRGGQDNVFIDATSVGAETNFDISGGLRNKFVRPLATNTAEQAVVLRPKQTLKVLAAELAQVLRTDNDISTDTVLKIIRRLSPGAPSASKEQLAAESGLRSLLGSAADLTTAVNNVMGLLSHPNIQPMTQGVLKLLGS